MIPELERETNAGLSRIRVCPSSEIARCTFD